METRAPFSPADRARAQRRKRRITVATGVAGAAAVVTFGGLAAISHPGSQVATTTASSSVQGTDSSSTAGGGITTNQGTAGSGLVAPFQPLTVGNGGGQTTTGGS
jgi:hypothetical protein